MNLRHGAVAALLLLVAAAPIRLGLLERQGLWADEVFSLAIATGHSLEHPAAVANPALGDFVEAAQPLPAVAYRTYLEHEQPAAGVRRVTRAVFLSDTNPPLYYVLLYGWTKYLGTGDAVLRLFSVLWALACLPLLWSIGKQTGGRPAAWLACLFFALSPVAIRYSTEGRMYSLLWFFVLLCAWSALRLHRRGASAPVLLAWVVASAGGLLTHYFFVFAWGAIWVWLLWQPGRLDRRLAALSVAGVAALVLPWYRLLPASLSGWRVTQDWLKATPELYRPSHIPIELAWSFFSARPWMNTTALPKAYILLFLLLAAAVLWHLDWTRRGRRSLLLILWIGGACLGPLVFDQLRGTYSGAISRYALPGLPAVFLLTAAALSRAPLRIRGLGLLVMVAMWLPGHEDLYTHVARGSSPIREVARSLNERADESDVILVHAIPSGMLGIARYLDTAAPVAPWVGQLGQRRVPDDVHALTAGHRRIFLVKIAMAGAPAVQEAYLREHAEVLEDARLLSSQTVVFAPRGQPAFFAPHVRPDHDDARAAPRFTTNGDSPPAGSPAGSPAGTNGGGVQPASPRDGARTSSNGARGIE